jgi:actin related protein 2/3 complex subunit 2
MILLEIGNRILAETVDAQINAPPPDEDEKEEGKQKKKHVDIHLCDFDGVTYRVMVEAKEKNMMTVLMSVPAYADIKGQGGEVAFKECFGDLVTEAIDGYSVAVQVNLDTCEKKEEIVNKIKVMKHTVIGGVFKHFYNALAKGEKLEPFKFDLRVDTTVFFVPDDKGERMTTIFALDFSEKVDKVLAKVFMQEFVDARRTMGFAPPVAWGAQPPSELAKWGITENKGATLGYISFPILKPHVSSPDKIERIVAVLGNFRTYIQYHIKCSKSYFHARMRARVVNLIKVLNRAKVEDPEKDKTKGKKTISGKTFRRAV